MPALRTEVINRTARKVQITYIDRHVAKWWNARRKAAECATFTGWYWFKGRTDEAGPFKTKSAAIRDAYYTCVLGREVPQIGPVSLRRAEADRKAKAVPPAAIAPTPDAGVPEGVSA